MRAFYHPGVSPCIAGKCKIGGHEALKASSLLLLVVVGCGDVHLAEDPLEAVGDGGVLRVGRLDAGEGDPAGVAAVRVRVLDQGAPVLILRSHFGFVHWF